jgi:hypothetical protein
MGLLDRLLGRSDPWSRVPQPVAAALSAGLSPTLFARLTETLTNQKLFTAESFPATWASLPALDALLPDADAIAASGIAPGLRLKSSAECVTNMARIVVAPA